jgi:AbiU2
MPEPAPRPRSTSCCVTEDIALVRQDFENFREECVWCCIVFNTHQALFEGGEDTSRILKESAHHFFFDYSVISQEYHVMLVGRLTDQPGEGDRSNLTVRYLVQQLKTLGRTSPEIESAADAVQNYRPRILDARNKLVAHRDVKIIRNGAPATSWPIEEVRLFHRNLNTFCDLAAIQLELAPSEFCNISTDTFPLIKHLQTSLNVMNQRKLKTHAPSRADKGTGE